MHGVGKLNDVSLLEPVLSVEVLLGETFSLGSLKAFVGCVELHEGVSFIGGRHEVKPSIAISPDPSEEPVEDWMPLGHGQLTSQDVSELKLA